MSVYIPLFSKLTIQGKPYVCSGRVPESDIVVMKPIGSGDVLWLEPDQIARGFSSGEIVACEPSLPEAAATPYQPARPVSAEKLMTAETRQSLQVQWDAEPPCRKKRRYVESFLKKALAKAAKAGLRAPVTQRMFEDDRKKGAPGARHLGLFICKRGHAGGKKVQAATETKLQETVDYYYEEGGPPWKDAFDDFKFRMLEENGRRKDQGLGELPIPRSFSTLRRRILSARDHANVEQQTSRLVADRTFRGSKPRKRYSEPLELVVVDNTVIDVHVVDLATGLVLGRPILSIALCVTTRCILGYAISFEPPSNGRLLSLIKHVICDKQYVKKFVPDLHDTWNPYGLFKTILFDRALENQSRGLKESCASIGINIEWSPPNTPEYKAWVESLFRTLNILLFHNLPGAVAHTPHVMRELQLKPATGAVLNLEELEILLIKSISMYENQEHTETRRIPSLHMKKLQEDHPRRMLPNISMIDELISETAEVNLWTKGIRFKTNTFSNPVATTIIRNALLGPQLAIKSGRAKRKAVRVWIRWNPEDCSRIVAFATIGGKVASYEFTNRFDDTRKISFRLDKLLRQQAHQLNYDYENEAERLAFRVAVRREIRALFQVGTAAQRKMARAYLDAESKREVELPNEADDTSFSGQPGGEIAPVTLIDPPGQSAERAASQPAAPRRGAKKAARTKADHTTLRTRVQGLKKPETSPGSIEQDPNAPDLPSFL